MRKHVQETRIEERRWNVDDVYLVCREFQVLEEDGFKAGDIVTVTVEKKYA